MTPEKWIAVGIGFVLLFAFEEHCSRVAQADVTRSESGTYQIACSESENAGQHCAILNTRTGDIVRWIR